MNHITELSDKYNSLFDGWFKNLTALSIGALTFLVSLMPQSAIPSPGKYFLIACWILLGASILFGLIGSFRPVVLARLHLLMNLHPLTEKNMSAGEKIPSEWGAYKLQIIIYCQNIAVVSFFLAFVNLVIYACLKTIYA